MIAAAIGPDGSNYWTMSLPFGPNQLRIPIPMVVQRDRIFACLGNRLVHISRNNYEVVTETDSPILSIASSTTYSQQRLLLGCEQGAELVCREIDSYQRTGLVREMQNVVVGISGRGYLIVADDQRCEVYRTSGGHPVYYCEFPLDRCPISILVAPQTNQFGIAFKTGPLLVFEIPQL